MKLYEKLMKTRKDTVARVTSRIAQRYGVRGIQGTVNDCPECGHPALVGEEVHKCCPHCGVSAEGAAEIEIIFGYRRLRTQDDYAVPQSYCRQCRTRRG